MPRARDLVRGMRRQLHARMCIPGNYYPGANAPAVPVSVRLIDGPTALTNAAENRYGLGGNEDAQPKLIFMLDEMDPATGAVVCLEADEVYQIMAVDPPHDITVTANCVRLSLADCAAYSPPSA